MDLKALYPHDIFSSPEEGINGLLQLFIMRTNFVPGIRHVIGWRGLRISSLSDIFGFSAKIKDSAGIYGVHFNNVETINRWVIGQFCVYYFPDPQEELIESLSVPSALYAQNADYKSHIRDFLSHQKLCNLFNIGIIYLGVNHSETGLILGLESVSRHRVIAQDGISFPFDGDAVVLVEPGDYEQDFPSFTIATALYAVVAASITFTIEEPPVYLRKMSCPGTETVYDSSGRHWETRSHDVRNECLFLGYGMGDFNDPICKITNHQQTPVTDVVWEKGTSDLQGFKDALWWHTHEISNYKTFDKKILGIDDRPQMIIVTGFLGSGKTSFLQHFIEYQIQLNRFVAVVQNEIGELGLDGKLLDHDYSVVEIDEGCVCCTLVGSLNKGITQILSHFHPDYIVVEMSGLANPLNILDELSEIEEVVRFDSVTTIIDCVNIDQSLNNYDVAYHQIEAADILLINKKDLVTTEKLSMLTRKLRIINKTAPIIPVVHGDINPALLYEIDSQDIKEIRQKRSSQTSPSHTIRSHENDGIQSLTMRVTKPLEKEVFIKIITSLPHTVFRMKGVLDFHNSAKPNLFQYVNGRFEFSEFSNPKMQERFLTLVGQHIYGESGAVSDFLHNILCLNE